MASVIHSSSRRQHGVHYTSRENILRVIGDLFLDELDAALEKAGNYRPSLETLHDRIGGLTFLDPACGSGDFLVVVFEELQRLETAILRHKAEPGVPLKSRLVPSAFHGFEIDPEAAGLASQRLLASYKDYRSELVRRFGAGITPPHTDSPRIIAGNALQLDWEKALPQEINYIVGNPPYVARQNRSPEQNADMKTVFPPGTRTGLLDYAAAWFMKSAQYMQGRKTKAAFVVTNSITQGEQVQPLWQALKPAGIHIHFARRTFRWTADPDHRAGVSVVIVGFAGFRPEGGCRLYHLENNVWRREEASEINPHLVVGSENILLPARHAPLSFETPPVQFGSMPNDGGFLLLTDAERKSLSSRNSDSIKFIRPLITVRDYFAGRNRWCLWLEEDGWQGIPEICERVEAVRRYRLASRRAATVALAQTPHLFGEIRQPRGRFVLIPLTSSEHRRYIPLDLLSPLPPPGAVLNNTVSFVDEAEPFHLGVLTSRMHMAWTNQVCGRLEGRYRYSNRIVYNNFPWPEADARMKESVGATVRRLLSVRGEFLDAGRTMAGLYHPQKMPPELMDAHRDVDEAVERCYRAKPFDGDTERLAFLFQRYREYACGEETP